MPLSTKITQGFTAVGTKVKALDLATVKSVNSVTPNSSGNVKITMISGNAGSATKLETARTISLIGDVTGSVSFDGTDNVSITTIIEDDSHNHTIANVDNLQSSLDAKAPLASPTFTGTPSAPTATAGTNTTQIATTAFVTTAIANKTSVASATKATQDASGNVITLTYATKTENSNNLTEAKSYTDTKVAELVDSSPATLDTLNELAAALGDDPNFATTVLTQIGTKADDSEVVKISGDQTINGTKTFSTIINGSISGNAATAAKAIQDNLGNVIDTTYAKTSSLGLLATKNTIGSTELASQIKLGRLI